MHSNKKAQETSLVHSKFKSHEEHKGTEKPEETKSVEVIEEIIKRKLLVTPFPVTGAAAALQKYMGQDIEKFDPFGIPLPEKVQVVSDFKQLLMKSFVGTTEDRIQLSKLLLLMKDDISEQEDDMEEIITGDTLTDIEKLVFIHSEDSYKEQSEEEEQLETEELEFKRQILQGFGIEQSASSTSIICEHYE